MEQLPLVRVTWLDAWLDTDAEVALTDLKEKLQICTDVGFLLKKTKKSIILACNYQEEDHLVRFVTQIPTVLVLKIEEATNFKTTFEKNGARDAQKDGERAS